MRFEKEVTVNASAEDVYNYVADFSRHGEWGGHGLQIEAEGGTRLIKSQDFVKPSLLCRIMTPMVSSQRPKELAGDMERIKERLES